MHFLTRKRYRFFYPAGLLSLVLLPIVGVLYFKSEEVFGQKYAKELNVISAEQLKQEPFNLPDPRFSRKYRKINLTGDKKADLQKLALAQKDIRKMLSGKDTVNGVQIVYGPKAKYESMIEGLDICQIENARTYLFLNSNLWVFYQSPKRIPNKGWTSVCGGVFTFEVEQPKPASTFFGNFLSNFQYFWPIGILYLIMAALTIQKIVRQLRNQQLTTSN